MNTFSNTAVSYLMPYLLCFIFALLPLPAQAEGTKEQSRITADRLHSHLDSLASLNFQFTQRTTGPMSGRPRQASGEAFFVKIGDTTKMRWNYTAPDAQVIISDGVTLTMYFEQMQQMIIAPAESLQQDVTYAFFTGKGNIEDQFIIEPNQNTTDTPEDASYEVITLTPKAPTSQIKSIRLWVNPASQIQRIEMVDKLDTVTLLNLSNIEENSLIEEGQLMNSALFHFSPPEGTEIIHQ